MLLTALSQIILYAFSSLLNHIKSSSFLYSRGLASILSINSIAFFLLSFISLAYILDFPSIYSLIALSIFFSAKGALHAGLTSHPSDKSANTNFFRAAVNSYLSTISSLSSVVKDLLFSNLE